MCLKRLEGLGSLEGFVGVEGLELLRLLSINLGRLVDFFDF